MEGFITDKHIDNMAKVIITTGLIVAYGYGLETFIAWYSGEKFERFMTIDVWLIFTATITYAFDGNRIDLFNAKSDYYLSMHISYPNASDLTLKEAISPGGAIMMHGNCVTIGCLPMTDDKIKELYVLCLEARNRNNPIYIDIFPAKFTPENLLMLAANYPKSKQNFWKTLKPAYDYFETNKRRVISYFEKIISWNYGGKPKF